MFHCFYQNSHLPSIIQSFSKDILHNAMRQNMFIWIWFDYSTVIQYK